SHKIAQRMNIPDKKTDLKDNRNARSFLKTRIQTESAGFFNGLLNKRSKIAVGDHSDQWSKF
ncbi:hypothetical protein, partial [Nitrosomonas sp.]|uniref:hypothetical protein n=1 Tax=Nitrosomonas sp. TaxID=42353 RepID=UPI0025DDC057